MDALIYLPTAQTLAWNLSEPIRAAVLEQTRAALPPHAYAIRASVTPNADLSELLINRVLPDAPLLIFAALELPLPLIARPRDYWYPQLTERIRPERHPPQARPSGLVAWGLPQRALNSIRDTVPINDPRTGGYMGRAFWRVDRQGYWGCWSDSTENDGPCLTLAELVALLCATRGTFAD